MNHKDIPCKLVLIPPRLRKGGANLLRLKGLRKRQRKRQRDAVSKASRGSRGKYCKALNLYDFSTSKLVGRVQFNQCIVNIFCFKDHYKHQLSKQLASGQNPGPRHPEVWDTYRCCSIGAGRGRGADEANGGGAAPKQ